jgi:hypothetical protein
VAAVVPLGFTDPNDRTQWLVLQGTLKESDLAPLLDTAISSDAGIVTLDLCDLATLTHGGCWTIRGLADDLWARGCRLAVVFPAQGPVADMLRSTGTMGHPRVAFHAS